MSFSQTVIQALSSSDKQIKDGLGVPVEIELACIRKSNWVPGHIGVERSVKAMILRGRWHRPFCGLEDAFIKKKREKIIGTKRNRLWGTQNDTSRLRNSREAGISKVSERA